MNSNNYRRMANQYEAMANKYLKLIKDKPYADKSYKMAAARGYRNNMASARMYRDMAAKCS